MILTLVICLLGVSNTQGYHSMYITRPKAFSNTLYSSVEDDDGGEFTYESLGTYTEEDFKCFTKFEWDPDKGNPNDLDSNIEYIKEIEVDEEGIEVGWDPMFGSSNTFDTRTIITETDSYMIAESTRDDSLAPPPLFDDDDPELALNKEVEQIRKDMKIIDTYRDEHLDVDVPRNVAPWYGEPEEVGFPEQDFMNNRFTKPEDKTDFTKLTPFKARQKAVHMARSNNNEWLPEGTTEKQHAKKVKNFHKYNLLVGSFKKGECDPAIVQKIQPALKIFGSSVELLSIQETVFRFRFYGPMKHRHGMASWMKSMISDAGVECTGVVFETGERKRDPWE